MSSTNPFRRMPFRRLQTTEVPNLNINQLHTDRQQALSPPPQQPQFLLTPPAQAHSRDIEGEWPFPAQESSKEVERESRNPFSTPTSSVFAEDLRDITPVGSPDPFATPTQSIYADSIRNISNPNISRPASSHNRPNFQSRASSFTFNSPNGKHSPVYHARDFSGGSSNSLATPNSSMNSLPLISSNKKKTRRRPRDCLHAVKEKIIDHVDPKTVKEMIDFRETFYPITLKKYLSLAAVASLIAAIVVTEHYFHWIEKSMAITRRNMLAVLIVVIGLEPMMITFILLVARLPSPETAGLVPDAPGSTDPEKQMHVTEKIVDHRTALVIPCHNSDHEATIKTLESAYPHFRPQDIFIVDNGRTKYPPQDFRKFIHEQHPDIRYIWSPIGSKNAAQLVGAIAANEYEFIMTVDDDVLIPKNFRPPIDKIDDVTKGVAFPLRGIDSKGNTPMCMVAWQDAEYKMAGLAKLAESSICGVLYPHGAGWFCERETMVDLISNYHSLDFIAEDVNTGLSMQKMKKRIAFDARIVLETEVPTTLFGRGLNWWHQRKNSWEMGRHGRLLAFAGRLFLSLNGQTTIHGILAQKFIHVYAIATLVVDWVRVPVLVTMGGNPLYWRQALLLTLASIFPPLVFKYVHARRRPDMQPRFWACVTFPYYKQLYALVSIFGAIRCVLFYIGGHNKPKTARQMIKENDERVIWKDPRFELNPAFLADEAEALKSGNSAAPPWTAATTVVNSPMNSSEMSITPVAPLVTIVDASSSAMSENVVEQHNRRRSTITVRDLGSQASL